MFIFMPRKEEGISRFALCTPGSLLFVDCIVDSKDCITQLFQRFASFIAPNCDHPDSRSAGK
jgi:hypothetical protein